jgi:hypothetical protein
MNKRKINEQELNYIVENSIRKTLNEKQQVNEEINEVLPLVAPLAGAALRAGGKYLAKKGIQKLAKKGMQKLAKKGMKNMGQNFMNNMMNNQQQGQQQGNGINFQQLIQAFQNFMQIYRTFKGSGQQTNPMFDKLVGNLGSMLLREQEMRNNKTL